MANYYTVENSELIMSARTGVAIPYVFIIDDDATDLSLYRNTSQIGTLDETLQDMITALLSNGAGGVYVGTLTHFNQNGYLAGNTIRFVINTGATTTKALLTQLEADEADGLCRYLFKDKPVADELTGVTENQKSRLVYVDDAENICAVVGACCANAFNDPALPMSNVPLVGEVKVDNTLRRGNYKTKFMTDRLCCVYYAEGLNRIFAIPTQHEKTNEEALYFDFSTRVIVDEVAISVITWLVNNYPRTKRNQTVLDSIQLDTVNILQGWADRGVIENFDPNTVACIYDPNDRFGVIVSYTIDVVTPLYNVTIKQSVTLGSDGTVVVE